MDLYKKVEEFLRQKPSYLKCGNQRIADACGVNDYSIIKQVKRKLNRGKIYRSPSDIKFIVESFRRLAHEAGIEDALLGNFIEPGQSIKRKRKPLRRLPKPFLDGDPDNILFIGDLHEPFCLENYLDFNRELQEKYNCGTVIFIGDIIDNHYSSYHESDPDGYSAGQELEVAIERISNWYKVFPEATVIIGNHDRMAYRKAFTGGISERWIRDYGDVLNTPNWKYVENLEIFGANVNHGEGGTARNRMKNELQSQIQGHIHSQMYVDHLAGSNFLIFGMQVGCGIDREAYAMAYGKYFKKPLIGSGVLLNKGTLPLVIPMKM